MGGDDHTSSNVKKVTYNLYQNSTSLSYNYAYDSLGNPLSYYNGSSYTLTWKDGRKLATLTKGKIP